ncbi:MAG: DUF2061 domain-containing protein [Xanthobacteraceae bacterium]|jgi:uncharacterized membrane protein
MKRVNAKSPEFKSRPSGTANNARTAPDILTTAATVGVIAAGVALLDVALIPGLVIGGAAVLAPKYAAKYWPKLRQGLKPLVDATVGRPNETAAPGVKLPGVTLPLVVPAKLGLKQALVKTITFRIIVTTLDFTSNYVVIGELGTSAGLSAFGFVVAPLLYLAHEAGWNYFGPPAEGMVEVMGFEISRALAKTVTFRVIATTMDFTTLYVVVGDLPTAVGLAAFGFVVGPFVYYGHEWLWDRYGAGQGSGQGLGQAPIIDLPAALELLPAPG